MFWSETLKESSKFCACHAAWSAFRIAHIEVIGALLTVYVTPEDGNRSLLFSMRRGEQQPTRLSFDLKFKSFQHVRFEIKGGEMTLVGESHDGGRRTKYLTRFLSTCPFGDEGNWKREKIVEDHSDIKDDNVQKSKYNNNNDDDDDHDKLTKEVNSDNAFVKANAQTEDENYRDIYDNDYDNLLRKVDLNKVFLNVDGQKEDISYLRIRWLMREKEMERQNRTITEIDISEDDYDDMLLKADLTRIFKIQPNDDDLVKEAKKKVYEKLMERRNKALLKKEGKDIINAQTRISPY